MNTNSFASLGARMARSGKAFLLAGVIGMSATAAHAAFEASAYLDWSSFSVASPQGGFAWKPDSFWSFALLRYPGNNDFKSDWTSDASAELLDGPNTGFARIGDERMEGAVSAEWGSAEFFVKRHALFTLEPGASVSFSIQGGLSASHAPTLAEAHVGLYVQGEIGGFVYQQDDRTLTGPGSDSFTAAVTLTNLEQGTKSYSLTVFGGAFVGFKPPVYEPPVPEPASVAMALSGAAVVGAMAMRRRRQAA